VIEVREAKLKNLNYFVISGDGEISDSRVDLKRDREEKLKEMVLDLNEITNFLMARVRELLGLKRIFGNAFIYDGMDYMKVVVNEVR